MSLQPLVAELELCQLYLARLHRERILERRNRPVLVDATTQTSDDGSNLLPTPAAPGPASGPLELPALAPAPAVPERPKLEIVVRKVQATQQAKPPPRKVAILSPTKRKPLAPRKPGVPRKRILVKENIQLVSPRKAPKTAVIAPSEEPIDLTAD